MPFVAFEGGEGVGKTTQLRLLQDRLPKRYPDKEFIFTREPGGTEFGEQLRQFMFSDVATDADGKTMFGLFMASRFAHVSKVIRPAIQAGKVVITDRYLGSSFAYQVIAQEGSVSHAFFDAHVEELGCFPDITLVLQMDPEKSQERLLRRFEDKNRFDTEQIEFHKKLCEGYDIFLKKYGNQGACPINADQSQEEVYGDIMKTLASILR